MRLCALVPNGRAPHTIESALLTSCIFEVDVLNKIFDPNNCQPPLPIESSVIQKPPSSTIRRNRLNISSNLSISKLFFTMAKELLSAILLSSLACEAVAGIIQLDTWKQTSSPPTSIGARQSFQESIINNVTGGSYMISTCWGTPCQNISLVLDTGSSDVWALANNADQCTSATIQRQYGPCVGGTCQYKFPSNVKSATRKKNEG